MFATATHYISMFNTNYVEPVIDKNHKMIISTIGISVLLVAAYKSPQTLDITKKNIKFLTIVVPIGYTMTFPLAAFLFWGMEACGAQMGRYERDKLEETFVAYLESIIKVWTLWFKFVGISA